MTGIAGQLHAFAGRSRRDGTFPDFDDQQFADWADLLEHRFGLFIAPERRSFLVSGLRTRMRETGCKDYREYYRHVSNGASQAKEWSLLVDCLTVHETCFFRHASSLKLVEEIVIPAALKRGAGLSAWSIGCATGEETYSLAMLVDGYWSVHSKAPCYGVTGTDISLPSLRHARSGIYLNRRIRNIPEAYQARYTRTFSGERFQIGQSLRRRVCFAQLNLRDIEDAPFSELDLIYCQNVLIYFDRERRVKLVDSLVRFLRPEGILVLGPGELLDWKHPMMERVRYPDTLAYRRIQE